MKKNVDIILHHYLTCALWADGLDSEYETSDITEKSKEHAKKDIEKFLAVVGDSAEDITEDMLGHDIWLTRNGHGAGFFDRGYDPEIEKVLTNAAQALKEDYIYDGDDGRVYFGNSIG
jgi:hypothetical protein